MPRARTLLLAVLTGLGGLIATTSTAFAQHHGGGHSGGGHGGVAHYGGGHGGVAHYGGGGHGGVAHYGGGHGHVGSSIGRGLYFPYSTFGIGTTGYRSSFGYGTGYYGSVYPRSSYYLSSPGYSGSSYATPGYFGGSYYSPNYSGGAFSINPTIGGVVASRAAAAAVTRPPASGFDYDFVPPGGVPPVEGTTAPDPAPPVSATRAQVRVVLPNPDARVWFDGRAMRTTGTARAFVTPPLEPGYEYQYTIGATWNVNGRVTTQQRVVDLRAGQAVTIDFRRPSPAVATKAPARDTRADVR